MKPEDDSPDALELKPQPQVERLSKRPLWLVIGGLAVMILIMIQGVHTERKSQPHAEAERVADPTDSKGPLLEPQSGGLATPVVKTMLPDSPATESQGQDPAPVGGRSQRSQMAMQDMEQVRRYHQQMELQALQAPISVTGGSQASPRAGAQARPTTEQQFDDRTGAPIPGTETPSQDYDPTDRKDKEQFLDKRSARRDEWTLPFTREAGAFCEIKTGTVIPGIMLTGVNSDLPGKIIGQVSQHVYDTATGNMLVIPQGSRLFGVYDSRVAVGQNRVLIAWNRVVFPDGSAVNLETMPGTDQAGYGGLEDNVDNHYMRIFGSAMVMSLVSGGMAYTMDTFSKNSGSADNQKPSMQDEMGSALGSQLGQATLQLLQRNVNIKPTLEIRPGFRFNLVVVKDIVFDRPYVAAR